MPRVRLAPDDRVLHVAAGTTLLDASLLAGVPHAHACGGHGKCSTCRVLVLEGGDALGERTEAERAMAQRLGLAPEVRLACQAAVLGDASVRRLVLDEEDSALARDDLAGTSTRSLGEERRVAVLFADIRDFTPFAAAHPPYDVVHLLNRFFLRLNDVVRRRGGVVDAFLGDGAMALFGVDAAPDATGRAVRAGLDLLEAAAGVRAYVEAQYRRTFRIGVGIHAGPVILGSVGAGERRRLTAIGDVVNVASRIEGANKAAGTEFLVSAEAWAEVEGRAQAGRRVDLPLKGTAGTHALTEVTGWRE